MEGLDDVDSSSDLEGADFLKVFALEEKFGSGEVVQHGGAQHGCPMDEGGNAVVGGPDVGGSGDALVGQNAHRSLN